MLQITEEEIKKGIDEAYKKAGSNAYFSNGFKAGVDFALKFALQKANLKTKII